MSGAPSLASQVSTLTQQVENLTQTMNAHKTAHENLTASVNTLVETWNQANGILRFIKWLSVVAAAVTTIFVGFKTYVTHH